MTQKLSVWWNGETVGALQLSKHGKMQFVYSSAWLEDESRPAISYSLPKGSKPFGQEACRPFFAGLLPEDRQRDAIAGALGISKQNDFGLLRMLGGDVAGALTLWPDREIPPAESTERPKPLNDDELLRVLDDLPKRPLLAGNEGLRLSLAGAQSKLPIVLTDDQIALPAPGQATTHILKPPIARFSGTTENEAFVMTLAASVGLLVAPVEGRKVDGRPYLLVTRYDRRFDKDGRVQRLHQEDFCQALGVPPERKYASEGGPTFKASFQLLRKAATQPAVAVLGMLDAAIFNVIVGNADAHGKNFSLLYRNGATSLAPLYDLLSTVAYPELSRNFAMRVAKRATLEEIGPTTWPAFASDVGFSAPFVRKRVRALADAVIAKAPSLVKHNAVVRLDEGVVANHSSSIVGRAERVALTIGSKTL